MSATTDTSVTQQLRVLSDWSPERQLALMLGLCEAQMDSAMQESDQAVDTLIHAFTTLVETARGVGALTENLPTEVKAQLAPEIESQLALFSRQMASAVVAFQFYDKLHQRLGHVRYSLSALAMFVCDREKAHERDQWRRLFSTLRRLYRTEEERQLFKLMVEGASAEQAREHIQQSTLTLRSTSTGEIEIF